MAVRGKRAKHEQKGEWGRERAGAEPVRAR